MKYVWVAVVLFCGECVALVIFHVLKKTVGASGNSAANKLSRTKGFLERLTLLTGLLYEFPHILTAFAALKIGTRLKEEQDSHISNSYFLMGNLISVLLAMIYAIIIKALWQ